MTTLARPVAEKAPLHLWIVGGLALLWNAFGAYDYLITQLQVESYLGQFTEEQLAYFAGFPAWVDAAWAFGVWGAVLGSVLLLARSRWAVAAFGVSLAGMIASSVYTVGLTEGVKMMGGAAQMAFTVVIWVVAVALLVYARTQARRGVLR